MSRWFVALASCTVLFVGVVACGDDKKDQGFSSGIDGNTMLGNLTPAQQVTICQNQAAYVHAHVDTTSLTRFLCGLTPGVLLAASDDACEAALDSCVKSFSLMVDVNVPASTSTQTVCSTVPLGQCQGTVSDYEKCVDSLANVQLTIGTDFACGKRTQYSANPLVGVDACGAVGPACSAASQPQVR
jgi:hypothetical protein